ncbi:MAG: two-component system sensor histidine kinase NtrB, partial [Vicinamibacterales bacterium]
MSYLILGPAYIVVYLVGALILRTHATAGEIYVNAALVPPAIAAIVEIFRRRRRSAGAQRLFWDSFLFGMILWTTGQVAWAISTLVFHRSDWQAWHTLFTLSAGIGPLVAILTLPHRGRRDRESGATAVALVSYTTLAGFIYAYFVLVPVEISGSAASQADTAMFAIVQIQRLLLIVALAGLTAAAWATTWRTTYIRLLAGAVAALGFRMAATTAVDIPAVHLVPIFGLAWIVPFLCYAWAAAEAPSTPPASESVEPAITNVPLSQVLAIPVLLIPAIGYVLTDAVPMGEPGDSVRVLLTTLTMIAGLGLLVLRLSMQGTELKRADARVRLLAAATEQTEEIILITRADGAIEQANAAAVTELGYSRDALTSKTLYDIVERGFEDTIDSIGAEVRKSGVWRGTLVHRRMDGTTFPAANTVVALKNDEGRVTHFVGVGRDITEELQLRDQLVTNERMSAVGELIAGVAHEINNPLQTIIGSVELLMDDRTGSDRRDLELVRHEAARAGQIVRNLLAFVRHGAPDRAPADLNQIIRATAAVREHHLRQVNIALELYLNTEPLMVFVNREEIQQVVFNLLLNAEHAIGDEPGAIRI